MASTPRQGRDNFETMSEAYRVRATLHGASLWVASLACDGCAMGAGSTRMPHPGASAVPTNMVSIANEWGGEDLLHLQPGSLVSDATLVSVRAGRTCFDVALRLWKGAADHMDVSLEVDGTATGKPVTLHQCIGDTPCTPSDWRLPAGVSDDDTRVRRIAGRACYETPALPREKVTLVAQEGATRLLFRWQFDPQSR